MLIPLSLVGLFIFYGYTFQSFWAYFQVGGNINLYFPFAVFGSHQDWVSGFWLEDIVYLFAILGLLFGILVEKVVTKKDHLTPALTFGLIYLLFLTSVSHRDLARYSLPIWPIALTSAVPLWQKKYIQFIVAILFIPILLYTWQFVLANYQPISNWQPFL
jgi:hypothetical protein